MLSLREQCVDVLCESYNHYDIVMTIQDLSLSLVIYQRLYNRYSFDIMVISHHFTRAFMRSVYITPLIRGWIPDSMFIEKNSDGKIDMIARDKHFRKIWNILYYL